VSIPAFLQRFRSSAQKPACSSGSPPHGEIAEINMYSINNDVIEQEAIYDGFYAVCTNLDDDAAAIIKVNSRR